MKEDMDMREEGASQEPGDSTTKDIMEEIKELHEKHGGNLNKVAQALNELGIMTPRGREWSYQTLRSFLASRAPKLLKTREGKKEKKKPKGSVKTSKTKQEHKEKVVKTEEPAPKAAPPRVPPPPPGPDPLRAFVKLPDQPVPFVDGKSRGRSYNVLDDLYRLAEEKAKKDEVRTGGTMSSLVQTLIWAYLGGPKDFLVPLYNPEEDNIAPTGPVTDETPKEPKAGRTKGTGDTAGKRGGRPKKKS